MRGHPGRVEALWIDSRGGRERGSEATERVSRRCSATPRGSEGAAVRPGQGTGPTPRPRSGGMREPLAVRKPAAPRLTHLVFPVAAQQGAQGSDGLGHTLQPLQGLRLAEGGLDVGRVQHQGLATASWWPGRSSVTTRWTPRQTSVLQRNAVCQRCRLRAQMAKLDSRTTRCAGARDRPGLRRPLRHPALPPLSPFRRRRGRTSALCSSSSCLSARR